MTITQEKETFIQWFLKIRHHGICDATHIDGSFVYRTNGAMLVRAPNKEGISSVSHECEVTEFYKRFDWDWKKKREFFQLRSKAMREILVRISEGKETISRALTIETSSIRAITVQSVDGKRDRIPLIKPWRGKDCKITLDGTWITRAALCADIIRFIPEILKLDENKYRVWGVEAGDVQMAIAEILPRDDN